MADLATGLHHPHPAARHFAGLANRALGRLKGERMRKETVQSRLVMTGVGAGVSAGWAVLDHYFGGTDGEIEVGGFPLAPIVGAGLAAAAFLFGGEEGWADWAAAGGDALIDIGVYSGVRALLQAKAGS